MFVARLADGTLCSLLSDWTIEQLHALRSTQSFFCPVCRQRVQLKLGQKRLPHFAHVAKCSIETERESFAHLQGKRQLYNWFVDQRIDVHLERYLPPIQQRPDLFVVYREKQHAIEYQCSTIPASLFAKRTKAYMDADIHPLWLLHSSFLQRRGSLFSLSSFLWLFFNDAETIIFYCPERERWLVLHSLVPVSATLACGQLSSIPRSEATFSSFFARRFSYVNVDEWMERKKQWRLSNAYYRANRSFCRFAYAARLVPPLFPLEAGIPLRHAYWLETPPFIWQTYMLIELMNMPLHETFSFSEVYEKMKRLIRQNMIHIRQLPLVTASRVSYAFMDYLFALVSLRLLKKVGKQSFQRIRSWSLPQTSAEAIEGDERVLRRIANKKEDFFTKRE